MCPDRRSQKSSGWGFKFRETDNMLAGRGHRCVVTGHRSGKSVVLSDQRREPYKFKTVVGCRMAEPIVQQATRHGWRNKGERPATVAFVMLGAAPASSVQVQETAPPWVRTDLMNSNNAPRACL